MSNLQKLSDDQLQAVLGQLQEETRKEGVRLYKPYPRQKDFHNAGALFRERLLAAANQLGKTVASAAELAIHLTGEYPDWWEGRRWNRPVNAWAVGLTGESTRDTLQRLLMGRPGHFGTGMIPADCIVSFSSGRGVADSLDTVIVKSKFGGTSTLGFKSAAMGRTRLQGETLDIVALDEEPEESIYTECLTRTNATGGIVWMTFTPLLGLSEIVRRFFEEKSPQRHVVQATIDDALHYTPEQRAMIIASYPPHERDARAKGIPVLGSGRVYPVSEELITCEAFPIPRHWAKVVALDFGISHPMAAAWLAHDRDTDCIYLYDALRIKDTSVVLQAPLIAAKGAWIPCVYPHDGDNRERGSGKTLADQYRELGVNMMHEPVKHPDGGNSVEAGVSDLLNRMQTGRFKVFSHIHDFFQEFRIYHRRNGVIHKVNEDLLDAVRYGTMGIRFAATEPRSGPAKVVSYNFRARKGGY